MLSIRPISNGHSYQCYLEKEAIGNWIGTGAQMLGLPQQVSAQEFRAIRRGEHPETGESLRVRRIVDRHYHKPWGLETYRARELYDLTISAPKSVSVQNIIDPRMADAHNLAVAGLRHEMEQLCGAMVVAAYGHEYSRKLDPQIHTHYVAANLAHDGEKWRTLHVNNLYRAHAEITDHYRQRLTTIIAEWGYRIDYPELADVPLAIKQRFSQRSQERESAVRNHMERYGMTERPSNKEIAVIIREHREEKISISPDVIRESLLARLAPSERQSLRELAERAHEHSHKMRLRVQSAEGEEHSPSHRHFTYGERVNF